MNDEYNYIIQISDKMIINYSYNGYFNSNYFIQDLNCYSKIIIKKSEKEASYTLVKFKKKKFLIVVNKSLNSIKIIEIKGKYNVYFLSNLLFKNVKIEDFLLIYQNVEITKKFEIKDGAGYAIF